jgi:hypothetical protein
VTEEASYWPDEFFAELVAWREATNGEGDLDSERLVGMCLRAAEEITGPIIENPRGALMEDLGRRAAFEARLGARWGRALDLFDLTVDQAAEDGIWINTHYRGGAVARQDQKFEALIRLHGRAVMTAQEVLVLLRSGYSTGALARWRTIHEIWVVFSLLADGDEELCRRYLVHEAIESMKGQEEYEETWEALGFEPPDWTSFDRDQLRASLAQEFGQEFLRDYGWAAPLFDGRAPRFRELQALAQLDHWRGYYRMASHGTHANPKGVSWNIQGGSRSEVIWAGPSNAGLVDPAQCTLIALANVNVGLLRHAVADLMTGDGMIGDQCLALVRQQASLLLMDRAIASFALIHEEQEREEEAIGGLIEQSMAVLRESPLMTINKLSERLELDTDRLEEALRAATTRGLLKTETRYYTRGSEDEGPRTS